ncbi:hypothetical protein B4589_011890 [Halolamina sp. CBA1230]|uniref:DUF7114 family protein n=1 Tax=Halolamina sp. CBA1230 TaxID=1853690 RepID=UPI0009A1B20F|nr:hypothetical protein [Halolamina sp. CBA1230]QKY21041.1 hypothetical protein B4589_011890 [Halolamina sp. CBA1230]
MDDAAVARRSARNALGEIEPEPLRETLDQRLATASMVPGALTLSTARAFDDGIDVTALGELAAGVQLIYEGLSLTRQLAHDEPWASDPENDIDADLAVVAADVLVSRGFSLLARTPAADRAVETVRAFGRDQTVRETAEETADIDRNLEADVFELAVVAGVAAVDASPPEELLAFAAELARSYEGSLPSAPELLAGPTRDRLAGFSDGVVGSAPRGAGTDP